MICCLSRRIKEEVEAVLAAVKKELTERDRGEMRKVPKYKYVLGLEKKPHVPAFGFGDPHQYSKTRDLMPAELSAAITVLDMGRGTSAGPFIGEVAVLNVGEAQEISVPQGTVAVYRPVEFHLGKNLPEADGNRLRNALAKYNVFWSVSPNTV